jgi:prepilin-type N-terminal cleavage/methylation domain-containing protein
MKKRTPDNHGFTLIEIIVSMVVLAILGVVAGRGMVEMANGYMLSKKNATVAQLGQITVARLKKEFSSITSITCGGPKIITYTITRSASEGQNVSSVYWAGGNNPLLLKTNSNCLDCTSCTGGDILVDNIVLPDDQQKQYVFRYCNNPTDCNVNYGSSNYTSATIAFVEVTLLLKGYGDTKIKIAYPDLVVLNLESGN